MDPNMKNSLLLGAVVAMIATLPAHAIAAQSAAKPPKAPVTSKPAVKPTSAQPKAPDTSAAAKAAFARIATVLSAAKGIHYTSFIKILVQSEGGKPPTTKSLDVDAKVQQPDKYRVQVGVDGKPTVLITTATGSGYDIDLAGNRYAKFESPDTPTMFLIGSMTAGTGLFDPDAGAAFTTLQTLQDEQPFNLGADAPPGALTTSCTPATFKGKPVLKLVQSGSQRGMTLSFRVFVDPVNGLPVHIEQTISRGAKTLTPYQEDFNSWDVASKPYPDSDFEYTPSATQTAYIAPVDPSRPALLANGTVAPDFAVTAPDGSTVKLSDFAGKPVVVDFWATWCGPCQKSLPITNKLAGEYGPKGVVFLGICSWDAKDAFTKWQSTRKDWGVKFAFDPAGEDQAKSIAAKYSVTGIPTQYFIGKDGKIAASVESYDPSDRHLRKLLDKVVAAQ